MQLPSCNAISQNYFPFGLCHTNGSAAFNLYMLRIFWNVCKKILNQIFFLGIFINFFWMKSEKVNQNQCLTRYTAHVGHSKMPRVLGKRHHLGVEGGKRPPSLPKKKGFRWVDPTLNKNTSYNLHTNFNILRYRENQRRGWRKYCFEYLFSIFPKCMLSVAL